MTECEKALFELKRDIELVDSKKYNKDQIPEGWITTTEWTQRRKNKNNNAFGRHWYNDGVNNYYLKPNDPKIVDLCLEKRRINCSFKKL